MIYLKDTIETMQPWELEELEEAIQEKKARLALDPNKTYMIEVYQKYPEDRGGLEEDLTADACATRIRLLSNSKETFTVYEQVKVATYKDGKLQK